MLNAADNETLCRVSAGTDSLENPQTFRMPEDVRAGGLAALRALGNPADVFRETRVRMFAA